MINHWSQIRDGDVLFKDTDMDDKQKGFIMRLINQFTTWVQNIGRERKIDGDDHSETLHWDASVLSTSSSVFGAGVRTQSFRHWAMNEGYPRVVILRRRTEFSVEEKKELAQMIAHDRGLSYALKSAVKSKLLKKNEKFTETDLIFRGLFCSETTLRWAKQNWVGKWPREAHEDFLNIEYYPIFDGDVYELIK